VIKQRSATTFWNSGTSIRARAREMIIIFDDLQNRQKPMWAETVQARPESAATESL
jgi:hypothetical protein